MGFAYCMCELVDQLLADNQEHDEIFIMLRDSLDTLLKTDTRESWKMQFTDFVHMLLRALGYLPLSRSIESKHMKEFVERITERRLRAWPLPDTN
jgi:recombinational DNA repair protein (RecF pathway)